MCQKVRKFATKIALRQNIVNQYFRIQIHIFIFSVWCTWFLFGVFSVLVGVLGVLFGVLDYCLAYFKYLVFVWHILYACLCLWHWDGASDMFITKNVQFVFIFVE